MRTFFEAKRNAARSRVTLVAVIVIVSSGCGKEKKTAQDEAAEAGPAVTVVAVPVIQKTVPVYTELTGRTDAADSVDIRARVKAFLMTQNYAEGSVVQAGQVLFTLDSREYDAQLSQAKAQLSKAQADLEQARNKTVVDVSVANLNIANARLNKANQDVKRLKPLAEQRAVPRQDYDDALAEQQAAIADVEGKQAALNTTKVNQTASIQLAEAAVQAAKASISQAELNIEFCTLKSPITGIAGTRQVAPGNLVGQGEPTLLTTVSRVDPLRVYVGISESDYLKYQQLRPEGKLKAGAGGLELILANGSTFPEKGRLIIVDRAVDLKTGTLNLVAQFPNPKALLRPGQFGRVRFAATVAENALLVPQKAVTELQSANVVYVIGDGNKIALRSIILGDRVGQDYIVTEGLKAGERIVAEGLQKVRPGMTVNPTSEPVTSEKGSATRMQ